MSRAARLAAISALTVVVLTGCGSSKASRRQPAMPPPTLAGAAAIRGIDPCKLLTRADITEVIGKTVGSPVRRTTASTATCTWSLIGAKNVSQGVAVQVVPASVFDTTIASAKGDQSRLPRTARTRIVPLPGVGDEAYGVSLVDQTRSYGGGGDLIAVRVGARSVFVSTDLAGLGNDASLIVSSKLATMAAARL